MKLPILLFPTPSDLAPTSLFFMSVSVSVCKEVPTYHFFNSMKKWYLCESESHSVVSNSPWHHGLPPLGSSVHADAPGKNAGVCCDFTLQGIFLTQRSNAGVLHSWQIHDHLNHSILPTLKWEVDYKESWVLKNWCFWTVVLGKTFESPLDCKEIQPVHPKISSEYSLEGLMVKLKLQYFSHLMQRNGPFGKILMLGINEGGMRREWERIRWLDVITDSMDMS